MTEFEKYPAYKDSGVEWLGELPTHWEVRRLKYVAEMIISNVDKHIKPLEEKVKLCNYVDVYKNDFIDEECDFMIATASKEEIKNFKIRLGDVVITKDSEDWLDIGVPALVRFEDDNLICGYHLAILRPRSEIIGDYLFRVLLTTALKNQFSVNANGITRYGISQGVIKSAWLILPPPSEQTTIANFLDEKTAKIDTAIAQKERLIALLEERKQIIIQTAVTKGIDSTVNFKDSGVEWLGEIPEHWGTSRSKWLFIIRTEKARPDDIQLSATQAYGVISQEEYMRQEGRRVTQITQHLDKRNHVEIDDFVISMRSFQGGLERAWETGCIRSSYVVLQPSPQINVDFFTYLFKSYPYIQALRATSNFLRDGQDMNFNHFSLVDLPLIPQSEQKAIAAFLDEQIKKIDNTVEKSKQFIRLLKEYKTILINNAVTGKIKIE